MAANRTALDASPGEQSDNDRYASWVPLHWLRSLRSRPTELAVLIAIASYANEAGKAWPSIDTIAADTGVRRDRVSSAITALENSGHLTRSLRPRTSSIYTIHGYRQQGPHSPVSINPKGPDDRVVTIPMNGFLPSHSAAAGSDDRSDHEVNVDDDATKEKIEALRGVGFWKNQALDVVDNPHLDAWLEWLSKPQPDYKSPVGFAYKAMMSGETPPTPPPSRFGDLLTTELEDDMTRRLRQAEQHARDR